MSRFLGQLRTLIWKDLLVEARGRETVLAGAVFALLVGPAATAQTLTTRIGEHIDQLIDAKLMVIAQLQKRRDLLNEIFQGLGRKELRFMQNFGFYFGVPMGIILVFVLQTFPFWWVLPVGGVKLGGPFDRRTADVAGSGKDAQVSALSESRSGQQEDK